MPGLVDPLIADLLADFPAVLVVGPRACGKTTTAVRHAHTIVRLDRETEAAAVRADPDGALDGARPVLLDEWQLAADRARMAQLRADVAVSHTEPSLYHLRSEQGRHEIDIIVEYADGAVFGFEVKAGGGPNPDDAKQLRWLRDELGDRFVGGAVLHSGPRRYVLTERIVAAPICALWA